MAMEPPHQSLASVKHCSVIEINLFAYLPVSNKHQSRDRIPLLQIDQLFLSANVPCKWSGEFRLRTFLLGSKKLLGGFLVDDFRRRQKIGGFWYEIIDFLKENRVFEV